MLNKKILATAIAGALTTGVVGAFDLDAPVSDANVYAAETIALTTAAFLENNGSADFAFNSVIGFSIAEFTSKYIRYDLDGATFAADVLDSDLTVGTATPLVAQGGTEGDSFVIFEVQGDTGGVAQDETVVFNPLVGGDAFVLSLLLGNDDASISYALYETAGEAVSETNPLKSSGAVDFAEVDSVSSGGFTTATNATADVAQQFTRFIDTGETDDGFVSATEASLGEIDTSAIIVASGALLENGSPATAGDIITNVQDVTVTGDFSVGTFTLASDAACSATVDTLVDNDDGTATAEDVNVVSGALYVCIENTGSDELKKGSYSVSLDDDGLTGDLGEIFYNTTSVEIPYITTFADYNQRFYIQNLGSVAVAYSTSFITEGDVTATPGDGATGSLEPGEVTMVRAIDMVTFADKTRGAGTFEFESEEEFIRVTTQIVDVQGGGTDTIVLKGE